MKTNRVRRDSKAATQARQSKVPTKPADPLLQKFITPAGSISLDEIGGIRAELQEEWLRLERAQDAAKALFYLVQCDMERQQYLQEKGIHGIEPDGDVVCGFMQLSDHIVGTIGKAAECVRECSRTLGALGCAKS